MIGQRLVEGPLEVGGAHAVGEVTVGTVAEEELPLVGHGGLDVLPTINVLLATVHNTNVTCSVSERYYTVAQFISGFHSRGGKHIAANFKRGQIQIQGDNSILNKPISKGGGG